MCSVHCFLLWSTDVFLGFGFDDDDDNDDDENNSDDGDDDDAADNEVHFDQVMGSAKEGAPAPLGTALPKAQSDDSTHFRLNECIDMMMIMWMMTMMIIIKFIVVGTFARQWPQLEVAGNVEGPCLLLSPFLTSGLAVYLHPSTKSAIILTSWYAPWSTKDNFSYVTLQKYFKTMTRA